LALRNELSIEIETIDSHLRPPSEEEMICRIIVK